MSIKENLFFTGFVEAIQYVPLLNEPCFLPCVDHVGLYRGLEMIAFPGTVFYIEGQKGAFYQVKTEEYPVSRPLFIDGAFIRPTQLQKRQATMPSPEEIIKKLKSSIGTPYLWGGNVASGVFTSKQIFKTPFEKRLHELKGVDCSGLLYEATGGCVPRNTSDLRNFGEEVSDVKPLDIIIWEGHVVIALDREWVIESKHDWGGVVVHPLKRRLSWVDEPFMVRRFL